MDKVIPTNENGEKQKYDEVKVEYEDSSEYGWDYGDTKFLSKTTIEIKNVSFGKEMPCVVLKNKKDENVEVFGFFLYYKNNKLIDSFSMSIELSGKETKKEIVNCYFDNYSKNDTGKFLVMQVQKVE